MAAVAALVSCAAPPPSRAPDQPAPRDQDYPWMSLATWHERRAALAGIDPEQKRRAELVLLGDSIVEGFDDGVWQEFYAPRRAVRLGLGGDRTENVLWRIEHGELDGLSPKVLVLLIGTNNLAGEATSPGMTAKGVAAVIDAVRARLPETKILVLGILPREALSTDPLRVEVATTNALIARFDDGRRVRYADVSAALLEPDGTISTATMADYLHPTASGYRRLAQALQPTLERMFAEGP